MGDAAIEALCEVALKILNINMDPFYEMALAIINKFDLNQIVQFVLGLIGK